MNDANVSDNNHITLDPHTNSFISQPPSLLPHIPFIINIIIDNSTTSTITKNVINIIVTLIIIFFPSSTSSSSSSYHLPLPRVHNSITSTSASFQQRRVVCRWISPVAPLLVPPPPPPHGVTVPLYPGGTTVCTLHAPYYNVHHHYQYQQNHFITT